MGRFLSGLQRKAIIFGAGARGEWCYKLLSELQIETVCFFDNNAAMNAEKFGIPIVRPYYDANAAVIIAVKNCENEIVRQLIGIGYSIEQICLHDHIRELHKESIAAVLEFPTTLQLPITHLCNFNCVMCGMKHMTGRKDFSADELNTILSDLLFSQIRTVGINGGEPFLKKDLVECIRAIVEQCKSLQEFYFISNGYYTERICSMLKDIKRICSDANITVNLSLSLDGIGDMQDFHRGCKNAYEHLMETVNAIKSSYSEYVDNLDVICTVTRHNVYRLGEVKNWGIKNNIKIAYNIATENVRIENEEIVEDFSLFADDNAKQMAEEFFFNEYLETAEEKYYGLFLYLRDRYRYTLCPCKNNEWITLTPDCELGYCATHSKKLGNVLEASAYEIAQSSLDHLEYIKKNRCSMCSHYGYQLNGEGHIELYHLHLYNRHEIWETWNI